MLGLVLFSLAGLWLSRKRTARVLDLFPWGFALLMGVAFGVAAIISREEFQPFLLGYMAFIAVIAGTGLVRTLKSLHNQKMIAAGWITVISMLVLGLLILILLPSVPSAREAARRTQCRGNLKQIGLAFHNWNDVNGRFPDAVSSEVDGGASVSWRVKCLPLLELTELSKQYDETQSWDSPDNLLVAQKDIGFFTCPTHHYPTDEQGRHYTAYAMMTGSETAFPEGRGMTLDELQSTSNTFIVVEAAGLNIVWTEPRDVETGVQSQGVNLPGHAPKRSSALISSYHSHGAHVAMADGSVLFISENTDPEVLKALVTRNPDDLPEDF
ncbi:MAG: DUF1559 domain-containing protein [Planctomycetaceae bacterium]|nr:DUF1559 domain-containing protein [Planctomycetaceae bacterium]